MSERAHQEVITELVSSGLLHPQPKMLGARAWSLMIPSSLAAVGFFCFAVLAFSFTELTTLSPEFRKWLVLVGSFSLAFGGEIGTLTNTVEIFRKRGTGNTNLWDWGSLVVSGIASTAAFILAFATLLGVSATWSEGVKLYGPIVLGVLAMLDAYGGFVEFGAYLGSHDKRLEQWRKEYKRAVDKYYKLPQPDQAQAYQQPAGDFAYTPTLPSPNGNAGYCQCGVWCDGVPDYSAHVTDCHLYETLYDSEGNRHRSASDALEALSEKYQSTMNDARWEFLKLKKVRKMREKAVQNWPEPRKER